MSAYWIDPVGYIIEVDSNHIHTIIEQPKLFGLTAKKIEAVYRKHGEPIGAEADAREEIMIGLMERGWIRVRYLARYYSVTVQFSDVFYAKASGEVLSEIFTWQELLTKWAKKAISRFKIPETVSVKFLNLGGHPVRDELQLYEVASDALYERKKQGTFAAYLNPKRKKRCR